MNRQNTKYDEEFKKSIVNLYQSGKRQSELSREYGISLSAISSWIKRSHILSIYSRSKKCLGAYKIRQRLIVEYDKKISVGRVYRLMK